MQMKSGEASGCTRGGGRQTADVERIKDEDEDEYEERCRRAIGRLRGGLAGRGREGRETAGTRDTHTMRRDGTRLHFAISLSCLAG